MKAFLNNSTELATYFMREENRKVYLYDPNKEISFLMFDYSLTVGDTYDTYSYDEQKMVSYRVLSVGDYWEGLKVANYSEKADSMTTQYRYLRKWTVCRTDMIIFAAKLV